MFYFYFQLTFWVGNFCKPLEVGLDLIIGFMLDFMVDFYIGGLRLIVDFNEKFYFFLYRFAFLVKPVLE
ncbi:hypothetical protein LINPERHAP2_LOCUS32256 [Linum perenne]